MDPTFRFGNVTGVTNRGIQIPLCLYRSKASINKKKKYSLRSLYTEEILDTCNRTPRSHIIKLPPGCKVTSTGEDTLDVGQCSDEPCSQSSSFSKTCGRKEDCCCGPVDEEDQERVVINCGRSFNDMVFHRVSECGCSTCAKKETVLKGELRRT